MTQPNKLTRMEKAEPIKLGPFHLTDVGLVVKGKPTFDEFHGALDAVRRMHEGSGLWLADLLVYAEKRPDWAGLIDAVIDSETLTEGSVRTYRSVAKSVPAERRVAGVGFGHVQQVASLDPEEQTAWLVKARDEGWTVDETRRAIREHRSTRVLNGQATDLAAAEKAIGDAAWLASMECRAVIHDHCGKAEDKITAARKHLDLCEKHVNTYRKLMGKKP